MQLAILQAEIALQNNEVPVGAIIVDENKKILAMTHNLTNQNICHHAEYLAIQQALQNRKYLDRCSLYVSLEPCIMCFGAVLLSRISQIFYAAADKKYGSISNNLFHLKNTAYQIPEIYENIGAEKSIKLLQEFFIKKR
jgi:tRNA(adenine34) deaminase